MIRRVDKVKRGVLAIESLPGRNDEVDKSGNLISEQVQAVVNTTDSFDSIAGNMELLVN